MSSLHVQFVQTNRRMDRWTDRQWYYNMPPIFQYEGIKIPQFLNNSTDITSFRSPCPPHHLHASDERGNKLQDRLTAIRSKAKHAYLTLTEKAFENITQG